MKTLAERITRARHSLGLSTRELARLTDIAYPTISRIENAHEDPRWRTIERIAAALGEDAVLRGSSARANPTLAQLVTVPEPKNDEIDWTSLRAFTDHLALHPERTALAIHDRPRPSGSRLLDNLLAGIAEKSADDIKIRRPNWAALVSALDAPWLSPGTPRIQQRARDQAPPQLAHRNVLVARSAIWRDRTVTLA